MLALTVRLVVSLAIVLGLLLIMARVGSRRFAGNKEALVHVVHRQALTRTSAVVVVTVGSRVLVLGSTEQQVRLLTELDPEDIADLDEPTLGDVVPGPVSGPDPRAGGSGGQLAGSVLSPGTWRQAIASVGRRAS